MVDTSMVERLKAILAGCDAIENATKLILFGSRARDDYRKDSDVDIMIVYPENMVIEEKMEKSKHVRTILADAGIDADVIIESEADVDHYRDKIGHIVRYAFAGGIVL